MLRPLSTLYRLPVACLLASATSAHALTTRCVGKSTQLNAALGEAMASADPVFVIRLRAGTYPTASGNEAFEFFSNGAGKHIELSGGWSGSGDTCETKSNDPSLTVLVGVSTHTTLRFGVSGNAVTPTTTAYVHDLTLRNPSHASNDTACLYGSARVGQVLIDRVQLEQCSTASNSPSREAAFFNNVGGSISLRNVSARDSRGQAFVGIYAYSAGSSVTRMSHVSVTEIEKTSLSAGASGLALTNVDDATAYVSNTVSWGNDEHPNTADIRATGNNIHFSRVHYGKRIGTPTTDDAPGTGDPGFIAVGNARLRPDSILVDSGLSNPQGGSGAYDADGRDRAQGQGLDVGAFEATPVVDAIFGNGFD